MNAISDGDVLSAFHNIPITWENIAHYRGYLNRQLLINRCADCGRFHHPPRKFCPDCWSDNVAPTAVSGEGIVFLMMWVFTGPPEPGVDYQKGHPVVTIELAEQPGLRFSSTLTNAELGRIEIGRPVNLQWIERRGFPWPAFVLSHTGKTA